MAKPKRPKEIESLTHEEARRRNIPTAEMQSFYAGHKGAAPLSISYPRATPLKPGEHRERNPDLDPQLVWRGKDEQDWSDLVVHAPPLYIQEKVHPKVIIEDLRRQSRRSGQWAVAGGQSTSGRWAVAGGQSTSHQSPTTDHPFQPDLFADFNGLPDSEARLEFYQHDQNWSNRMILGDSLQVMASLAEREGLRGQVQCIYLDPPYGVSFRSNWQVSTRSREVSEKADSVSREPEQIKAFRDTWKHGIHSYLSYLRDRLAVSRDLLAGTGSIFVQIGDENVHRVRGLLDEIFGQDNFVSQINVKKTATPSSTMDDNFFYVLWYAKSRESAKFRTLLADKPMEEWVSETRGGSWGATLGPCDHRSLTPDERNEPNLLPGKARVYALSKTNSAGAASSQQIFLYQGNTFTPGRNAHWKTALRGMDRLYKSDRLEARGGPPWFRKYHEDSPFKRMTNGWLDTSGKSVERWYVVQTESVVVRRCILMTSDPGDLIIDPTCGSGTSAIVAEELGRRWITIDTSRVALALARARIMGARYPYYLLADSEDGRRKEGEITGKVPAEGPTYGDIRQGFVYERVPHVTLKSIANNAEIDVIWEKWQAVLGPLRLRLSEVSGQWSVVGGQKVAIEEWEVPRSRPADWPPATDSYRTCDILTHIE
jgi:adenine-specific DNA-methyltransferase